MEHEPTKERANQMPWSRATHANGRHLPMADTHIYTHLPMADTHIYTHAETTMDVCHLR
jgi:hypothetical protein